jgi:hemolysin III
LLFEFREPASSWTHLVGAAAAVVGTVVLWRRTAGEPGRRAAALIFGLSMVLLYSASTAYHAVHVCTEDICIFRKADLCAIFLLIAGTYTPVCHAVCEGATRVVLPCAVWSLAAVGIAGETASLSLPDLGGSAVYIAMGWLGVFWYRQMAAALGRRRAAWVFVGGGLYTVGAVLDHFGWPVIAPGVWGSHETFHVFVLGGSVVFYFWILRCVLPYRRPAATALAAREPAGETEFPMPTRPRPTSATTAVV